MSEREGVFGAAREAAGSAAEQVRASAPGTYDAGANAARYIRDTASEHPLLAGTAVLAFIGGLITASAVARGNRRRDRQTYARYWRERGREVADRARSSAPNISRAADDVGAYIAQSVRENPTGLLLAAAVGAVLGYMLSSK